MIVMFWLILFGYLLYRFFTGFSVRGWVSNFLYVILFLFLLSGMVRF